MNYMARSRCGVERADQRSDIFALGVVLYSCLEAGKRSKGTRSLPRSTRFSRPSPSRCGGSTAGLSPELVAIVDRALAKLRDERYPDMIALRIDLETFPGAQQGCRHDERRCRSRRLLAPPRRGCRRVRAGRGECRHASPCAGDEAGFRCARSRPPAPVILIAAIAAGGCGTQRSLGTGAGAEIVRPARRDGAACRRIDSPRGSLGAAGARRAPVYRRVEPARRRCCFRRRRTPTTANPQRRAAGSRRRRLAARSRHLKNNAISEGANSAAAGGGGARARAWIIPKRAAFLARAGARPACGGRRGTRACRGGREGQAAGAARSGAAAAGHARSRSSSHRHLAGHPDRAAAGGGAPVRSRPVALRPRRPPPRAPPSAAPVPSPSPLRSPRRRSPRRRRSASANCSAATKTPRGTQLRSGQASLAFTEPGVPPKTPCARSFSTRGASPLTSPNPDLWSRTTPAGCRSSDVQHSDRQGQRHQSSSQAVMDVHRAGNSWVIAAIRFTPR